jgi:hypothetical protein
VDNEGLRLNNYSGSDTYQLVVIIDSDSDALHAVRVFDMLGRPRIMERWTGTSGVVDMRQLIPGVYFLAVFENERLLETVRLTLND